MSNHGSPAESPGKPKTSGKKAPSRKRHKQFSAWSYFLVTAITAAAVAVTVFIDKRNHRETIRLATEQFNHQQLILSRSAAAGIESLIKNLNDNVRALSNNLSVQRMQPGMLNQMELLYEGSPEQASSRRLDKNGILRFIVPDEGWRKEIIGQDYGQESHFKKAKETGKVIISGLVIDEVGDKRVRVVGPVYIDDEKGDREFNGVIMCSIDLKVISDLYISPIVSGKTGYAWLLNEDGVFLAHHEETFFNQDAFTVRKKKNHKLSYDAINRIQQQMMAGKEGVSRYTSGWHMEKTGKIEKLIAYTPVRVFDKTWSVAVCAPVEEVENITSKARRNELYTLGIIIIILTAAGAFFSIILYRWGSSLGQEIEVRKQAEGELAKHRDHLEEMIRERTDELQERVSEVEQLNSAMANLVDELQIRKNNLEITTRQLDKANKELEAFSYSVSHDLRAPLRAIDGFSRILLDEYTDTLDEQGKHYLGRVRAGTQKMGQLIEDLLNLSRIGRRSMEKKTIDIETIARKAYDSLEDEWKGRRVDFTVHQCPTVIADPHLMQIVFMNLLSNALKFTGNLEETEIEVGSETADGQTVFFVKDNGAGFDMKYADKLFAPFQRLHRAEEYEGTGIGLAIVQRIIDRHGGRIRAESEPGSGTTFYFTL